jgi:hypothetical protein
MPAVKPHVKPRIVHERVRAINAPLEALIHLSALRSDPDPTRSASAEPITSAYTSSPLPNPAARWPRAASSPNTRAYDPPPASIPVFYSRVPPRSTAHVMNPTPRNTITHASTYLITADPDTRDTPGSNPPEISAAPRAASSSSARTPGARYRIPAGL